MIDEVPITHNGRVVGTAKIDNKGRLTGTLTEPLDIFTEEIYKSFGFSVVDDFSITPRHNGDTKEEDLARQWIVKGKNNDGR